LRVGRGANKGPAPYEMLHRAPKLNGSFGTTQSTEDGYEIWDTEGEKSPYGRFTEINSKTVACQSKGKQKKNEGV